MKNSFILAAGLVSISGSILRKRVHRILNVRHRLAEFHFRS